MPSKDGTGRGVTHTDAGVAAVSLDDSLQLQAAFFPFPSLKRRRRRSRLRVAVAAKDGTMPREMEFVISRLADRAELAIGSRVLEVTQIVRECVRNEIPSASEIPKCLTRLGLTYFHVRPCPNVVSFW